MSLGLSVHDIVYYLDTKYVIEAVLDFKTVMAVNTETGTSDVLEIRHLTSKPASVLQENQIVDITQLPQKLVDKAKKRLDAIKPIYKTYSRKAIEDRSIELGVSPQSLYNWINAYRGSEQLSSLIFEGTDGGAGKSRLDPKIEMIVQSSIKDYFLTLQKPTVKKLHENIAIKCKRANLDAPGLATIRRRVKALNEYEYLKKREGRRAAKETKPVQKKFPDGNFPLEVIQIDHTQVDLYIVDEEYRIELGRPWITLAIDVYSRMVAGYFISMESPGFFGTGQCIANAILPKNKVLEKNNIKSDWPLWGIPQIIHADNAKEFRGDNMVRSCSEYGISLIWRPVARPNFGAHIERLLKTLHDDIHALKGTTFSNITQRGDYDSQKHATMTLNEFEEWIAVLIADVYHNKIHSELGKTPLRQYREGIFGSDSQPPRGLPRRIEDEEMFEVSLLPGFERTVQSSYGIQIDMIMYYSEVLNPWIGSQALGSGSRKKKKFLIRRDPRDISRIYFYDPELKRYFILPYRDTSHPRVSIWEYKAAQKLLKAQEEREYSEDEIFMALERMRQIEDESEKKTKSMRRNKHRRTQKVKVITPKEDLELSTYAEQEEESYEDIEPYDGIEGWE